jgi:hypothetical protein
LFGKEFSAVLHSTERKIQEKIWSKSSS